MLRLQWSERPAKRRINGNPDLKHVSTSFVERANLTMRMNTRNSRTKN